MIEVHDLLVKNLLLHSLILLLIHTTHIHVTLAHIVLIHLIVVHVILIYVALIHIVLIHVIMANIALHVLEGRLAHEWWSVHIGSSKPRLHHVLPHLHLRLESLPTETRPRKSRVLCWKLIETVHLLWHIKLARHLLHVLLLGRKLPHHLLVTHALLLLRRRVLARARQRVHW